MVSKSFDIDKIKKKTAEISKNWQKKMNYLSESMSRSGMEGATHWLKSHHQIDDLKSALEDLVTASEQDDFKLIQVETTLSSFILPEEDLGQAEWYRTASNLLDDFQKTLIEQHKFDKQKITAVLNELKFISQADEFHQRYQIQLIQQKVTQVYQELTKALTDFKSGEKEKLNTQKEQDKLKAAQIEADKAKAEAKKVMLESVKIKEKRLAIIEEKKRKLAERELLEAQNKHELENSELLAKQAETERQAKLQDAYIDLQLEEKINSWSVSHVTSLLQQKVEQSEVDEKLKAKISSLAAELDSRED